MLWVHGGGFIQESAQGYIPTDLATSKNVIVVVIQNRLGVLGFLSSGDDIIPGNYGLWDQALAIQWVKANIRAFGGDPDSFTVFGESAGAASVGYQVLSPANKGVNFRPILQIGTPLSYWALQTDPEEVLLALANQTGCGGWGSWADSVYYTGAGGGRRARHQSILACLRAKDVNTVIRALSDPESGRDAISMNVPAELLRDVAYLDDVGATSRDVMMGFVNEEEGTPQLTIGQSGAPWPEFSLKEGQYLSLEPVPRVNRDLFGKRVALWLNLLPSLVNSTAGIHSGSWALPWNHQQTLPSQGYSPYSPLGTQLPMRVVFKGRISFFKLN
ncbi:hypothetical protein ACOMHN_016516 [Nucella lapillus]